MPPRRHPRSAAHPTSRPHDRVAASQEVRARALLLAAVVALALAVTFGASLARAEGRAPAAASAQVASSGVASTGGASTGVASTGVERSLADVSYGCGWAQKRLADPAWRPFLSRVTHACRAIANNPDTRQITQQAYRERAFTTALDRAARGLDALYLEMWRIQLADASRPFAAVSLNDTGVFLALQHERVFRLADRIVLHYGGESRTAWLR